MIDKTNLAAKFALFQDQWSPKVVAELNGQQVRLVKLEGAFVWHQHDHEDELFLVFKGRLRMDFRDGEVWLGPGEMIVVPRGTEHRPFAEQEVEILLFEPASTLNTGSAGGDRTIERPERI